MSLAEKRLSNAYKGACNYRDKYTTAHVSAAAMSSLGLPTSKFLVEKTTLLIANAEFEIVTDISVVTT